VELSWWESIELAVSLLCFVGVCHPIHPLSNSRLLLSCVPAMPRRINPTDQFFMERILRAARLQFNMLPVGVENARIVRIYRRWLRRRCALDSPWIGWTARRLRILRIMTVHRTSGVGKCCFGFDFEVWVLLSKGVYCITKSLTLFLSLSFGGVVDWREQFLADGFLPQCSDLGLAHFVHVLWPEHLAEVRFASLHVKAQLVRVCLGGRFS
jgi:hypothetical protein